MIENKYASALDGLEIEDPVKSFFDFCKERENIRISRENGEDFPWSADEIFQNGRFLNVFREDDRVSKSIIKFASNLNEEPSKLINAVFFARWCNRQEVLDTLTPDDLNNPENLKNKLESIDPWCNETAYPVEPVTWKGKQYSRIDAATKLFYEIQDSLFKILKSKFNNSDINYVRNITDVDDKIRISSKEKKISISELTNKITMNFHEDCKYLFCDKPTEEPKATENISLMIDMINILLKKGNAYENNSNIYFSRQ